MPAIDLSLAETLTRCNAGRTIYDHRASLASGDRRHGQSVDNPATALPVTRPAASGVSLGGQGTAAARGAM